MVIFFGVDENGVKITEMSDGSRVEPDPTNFDTTNFPRKGCRQCGERDRPQYKGICNDDHCSHEVDDV